MQVAASQPDFLSAAQDIAGLISLPQPVRGDDFGVGTFEVYSCAVAQELARDWWRDVRQPRLAAMPTGAGTDTETHSARLKAVAEGLERHCLLTMAEARVRWATARELGGEAMHWEQYPACSAVEYDHPHCPVVPFDPDRKIRWVAGFDLASGTRLFVPAVMAYLVPPARRAEQFTVPISTGAAIHTSPLKSIISGALEVIERDALALTWLGRFSLPRLTFRGDAFEDAKWATGAIGVQQYFFDATTNVGIPVAYSIQRRSGAPKVATLVTAACSFDLHRACRKAGAEAVATRPAIAQAPGVATPEECSMMEHGAVLMGRPEHQAEFDFLFDATSPRVLTTTAAKQLSDQQQMQQLRTCLASLGLQAVVVDISVPAVRALGLHAFKVLIPELMPLSYHHRARFLAHPRLRTHLEAKLGSFDSSQINPFPQPFA